MRTRTRTRTTSTSKSMSKSTSTSTSTTTATAAPPPPPPSSPPPQLQADQSCQPVSHQSRRASKPSLSGLVLLKSEWKCYGPHGFHEAPSHVVSLGFIRAFQTSRLALNLQKMHLVCGQSHASLFGSLLAVHRTPFVSLGCLPRSGCFLNPTPSRALLQACKFGSPENRGFRKVSSHHRL